MNDAFIASMVLGSVLSATDPVAVSALLNEVRKKRRDAIVTGMTSGSPHTIPYFLCRSEHLLASRRTLPVKVY